MTSVTCPWLDDFPALLAPVGDLERQEGCVAKMPLALEILINGIRYTRFYLPVVAALARTYASPHGACKPEVDWYEYQDAIEIAKDAIKDGTPLKVFYIGDYVYRRNE